MLDVRDLRKLINSKDIPDDALVVIEMDIVKNYANKAVDTRQIVIADWLYRAPLNTFSLFPETCEGSFVYLDPRETDPQYE